jgi:hypothetical protein
MWIISPEQVIAQQPVHALDGWGDVAAAIAKNDVEQFVSMGVAKLQSVFVCGCAG